MRQGKRSGGTIKGGMGDFTAKRRLSRDYKPHNPFFVKVGQIFESEKCQMKILEKKGLSWKVKIVKGPSKGEIFEYKNIWVQEWKLLETKGKLTQPKEE